MSDKSPALRTRDLHIDLPAPSQEVPEDELLIAIPDVPVSAAAIESAGTVTIDIVPSHAIAVGKAHAAQAALEAAEAVKADVPPLPLEMKPLSRHGRRFKAPREDLRFEPSLPIKKDPDHQLPEGTWPEIVYGLTMTLVNLGDSRAVRHRKRLDARIAAPVEQARLVPVLSRQGGVGATTVTALLGMALADVRDDKVLAIDAHPDRGVLDERVAHHLTSLDMRATHSPRAFEHAVEDAEDEYALILADGATGVADPSIRAALKRADSVVLVSGGTAEQARLASETVDWLVEHDHEDLAANAVVAIDTATPGTRYESLDAIEAHFQSRVRDVVRIPFDEELVAGAPARYGALRPDTRDAARDLAALVMDGLQALPGSVVRAA